jgi:hypothetical protein
MGWKGIAMRTTRLVSRRVVLAAACMATIGLSSPQGAQYVDEGERGAALRVFNVRIEEYAALHRRLEGPLPPLTQTRETARNYVARQLLANLIRKERSGAMQGDIFEPRVATVFRAMIVAALKGRDVEAFLTELNEEHPDLHGITPLINEPLPRGATHEMPVVLLQVLPALPEDVEYRIVDHYLVLWDIHANLVVDFVPDAFRVLETTLRD